MEDENDRRAALREIWRVLKPGGIAALADIAHVAAYARDFETMGAIVVEKGDSGLETRLGRVFSGGTYCPEFVVVEKSAA